MGCEGGDIEPSRWGCCRSSGRRQRSEAGARIPRVGGRCRNVARAITTHRFGLWAVDGEPFHHPVMEELPTIWTEFIPETRRSRMGYERNRNSGVSEDLARTLAK